MICAFAHLSRVPQIHVNFILFVSIISILLEYWVPCFSTLCSRTIKSAYFNNIPANSTEGLASLLVHLLVTFGFFVLCVCLSLSWLFCLLVPQRVLMDRSCEMNYKSYAASGGSKVLVLCRPCGSWQEVSLLPPLTLRNCVFFFFPFRVFDLQHH